MTLFDISFTHSGDAQGGDESENKILVHGDQEMSCVFFGDPGRSNDVTPGGTVFYTERVATRLDAGRRTET